jgi:hypothetical protein
MKKQQLYRLPLRKLRELATDVQSVIRELEKAPVRRDIDIAAEHSGHADLIHSVARIIGDKASGRWRQIQNIYCCLEHCPQCPHGEFVFRYRRNKKTGKITVSFAGIPALPNDILAAMGANIRDPVPYLVSTTPDAKPR